MKRIIALTLALSVSACTPTYAKPVSVKITTNKGIDEYRISKPAQRRISQNKAVSDNELRIYSNSYKKPSGYTKFNYDEFKINGNQTPTTDKTGGIDELHIPEPYQKDLWQPEEPVLRMGIDEFKLPSDF